MRAIDADALQLAIVEEGQANKRKKYIIGDIWELTGAEIREVINSQPTIQPKLGTNLAEVGTDCISRQAVLNEFCHSCDGWNCNPNTCCKTEWIRKLPVIQPERKECEERDHGKCPWYAG